ncbi:MAG: MFS transporter, partial [Candidatus Promineifilaceae bacterium]|nr:MFS transporter [Candidatus Promineifilaceae bacterium]
MLRWQEVGSRQSKLVLTALICVVAMASLPLNMVNVAIPTIGDYYDATQTQLNMVAVSYSLGLACSVLWLGALGDRYGRKLMMLLGVTLTIPAALISAFAPIVDILIVGRLITGFAAGMAYPTTLSLITALWAPGPERTRAIAVWVGTGVAITVSGPLLSGILLENYYWGSIFLVIIPLALVALVMGFRYIPAHINESRKPVDNVGGILSLLLIGTFVLALNFLPFPGYRVFTSQLLLASFGAALLFLYRQRRAKNPLYDLAVAGRRIFWVAGLSGLIVFGSLMGGMYIGQQFLQDVLGYSTVEAGLAVIPLGIFILLATPGSAKVIQTRGTRLALLGGFLLLLLGYLLMLLLWNENSSYPLIGLTYALVGLGIGLAGTPSSRALTGSVPI